MQDPNPLPWGALDRFQAQFIVRKAHWYGFTIIMLQKLN